MEKRKEERNLLIVGAGIYGMVASEIAVEMGCFEKIDFVDDGKKIAVSGKTVVGTTKELVKFSKQYSDIVVAIGDPEKRLSILKMIEEELSYKIVSLISPKAYISSSAKVEKGCIIEPMAVVHTNCVIGIGCIISAGAVINHSSTCGEVVHVDCNATVEGFCTVPAGIKIFSGEVYRRNDTIEEER